MTELTIELSVTDVWQTGYSYGKALLLRDENISIYVKVGVLREIFIECQCPEQILFYIHCDKTTELSVE